ncbi:MAG: GGDEF domain-containing protein [Pseudomonadota bacterium]
MRFPTIQLLLGLLLGFGMASSLLAAPPLDLTGWEYRWGDSPVEADGTPRWTVSHDDSTWRTIAFPSNPPNRDGHQHVWFRVTLPDGGWRDPVLYIYSIDLIGQAYLDDELIYQYGHFDAQGRGDFVGWPWHMIELPEDFAGRTLHFRVFSDYTDIGLWGEVLLMERVDLLTRVIQSSSHDLVVSAFSLLLAGLAGSFALLGPQRRSFGAMAFFSLASGTMILAETQASQLLLDRPLLWDTLAAAGYYSLPVAMGLLLSHWLAGTPGRWVRRLWQLHLAYLVGAIGLARAGIVSLASTFPPFDLLLAFTLPLMLMLALWRVHCLGIEQRLIIASYALLAVLLLADMAVAHGLLAWRRIPVSLGTLTFSLAIVGISLWHYRQTQRELARLNRSLEQQVAQRTVELDRLVSKLESFSYEDPLTGLKNRRYFDELLQHEATRAERQGTPLSMVMIDLDHFKQINDRFGHEAGDDVLVKVAALLREHFRGSDVVCRLGGEEFVAILPGATTEQAEARAVALLEAVRAMTIEHAGQALGPVTFSCGVATYPCHSREPLALLGLADKALYHAKHHGRDRSITWSWT